MRRNGGPVWYCQKVWLCAKCLFAFFRFLECLKIFGAFLVFVRLKFVIFVANNCLGQSSFLDAVAENLGPLCRVLAGLQGPDIFWPHALDFAQVV